VYFRSKLRVESPSSAWGGILRRTYHIHSVIILCSVFHHYYCTQP
jgi:hypothetical protein